MRNYLLLFSIIVFVFSSCERKREFNKLAGVYEIYKYERVYFNTAGTIDSTTTTENFGTIALEYNDDLAYNDVYTNLLFNPACWSIYGVGVGGNKVYWYIDQREAESLTFFTFDNLYGDAFVVYTINRKAGKKMEWTTVTANSLGGISMKETIYVKKQ